MKSFKTIIIITVLTITLSSCNIFRAFFGGGGSKNGCPSNGKNVGAERLVEDNPKAKKKDKIPKAPKYKLEKF